MRMPPQARALVLDIYMGTSNANATFRGTIGGALDSATSNGETYDFGSLDALTVGLGAQLVSCHPSAVATLLLAAEPCSAHLEGGVAYVGLQESACSVAG